MLSFIWHFHKKISRYCLLILIANRGNDKNGAKGSFTAKYVEVKMCRRKNNFSLLLRHKLQFFSHQNKTVSPLLLTPLSVPPTHTQTHTHGDYHKDRAKRTQFFATTFFCLTWYLTGPLDQDIFLWCGKLKPFHLVKLYNKQLVDF
jgi:hypothetical protein